MTKLRAECMRYMSGRPQSAGDYGGDSIQNAAGQSIEYSGLIGCILTGDDRYISRPNEPRSPPCRRHRRRRGVLPTSFRARRSFHPVSGNRRRRMHGIWKGVATGSSSTRITRSFSLSSGGLNDVAIRSAAEGAAKVAKFHGD